MKYTETPTNEKQRLEALYSYDLFNKIGQTAFDDIVKLASQICETPISLITLVTEDKQVFKAKVGLDTDETDRDIAFCAHAILIPDKPLIVQDASKDDRFNDNPLVTGDPHIAFYAGIPLTTNEGYSLGTLCVIDTKPRELTKVQLDGLRILSKQVLRLFELKRNTDALEVKDKMLVNTVNQLNRFSTDVSHDMKTAFRNIEITVEVLKGKKDKVIDQTVLSKFEKIEAISKEAMIFLNGVDKYVSAIIEYDEDHGLIEMDLLIKSVTDTVSIPDHYEITIQGELPTLFYSAIVLKHIFQNLLQNCVEQATHPEPKISLNYEQQGKIHKFTIQDNGSETYKSDHHIYEPFTNNIAGEKVLINNTGVGLAIVKRLTELSGGDITHAHNGDGGTVYTVSLPVRYKY